MIVGDDTNALIAANRFFNESVPPETLLSVCRCEPSATSRLSIDLTSEGCPTFSPVFSIEKRKTRHTKSKSITHHLFFPSYLFVSDDSFLESFRGRVSFLKFGDHFATMVKSQITQFDRIAAIETKKQLLFAKGDKVRIIAGTFNDLEGIITSAKGSVATVEFSNRMLSSVTLPTQFMEKV